MRKKRRKKKKIKAFLFLALIILIIMISIIINIIKKNEESIIKVTLVNELEFDVNSDVKISSLFSNIENGTLVDENEKLDTSIVGKRKVKVKLINKNEKEEFYSFEVNIIDKEKPVIESEDKITIEVGDEIDLLSKVSVSDNYDDKVDVNLEGTYDNNKEGTYDLSYIAKDSSGNETKKNFTLVVEKPKYRKMKDKTITTEKGYTLKIENGVAYIDGILIANKTYYLPENYTPKNPYTTLSNSCVNCLEKEVMTAYQEMNADAKTLGLKLWLASGYRSYSYQESLYSRYVQNDGKKAADTYSARAGHSEHQTGLAFDLNNVDESFGETAEGKWIKDNCYRFGFIIRYPKGKEEITGYIYEPWHLRYVGKELAEKIYNKGNWTTLEEYFGIDSKYKD